MADRYWRVLLTMTRTDEFFVEADDFDSPEAAAKHVMADGFRGLDPENEFVTEPIVSVRPEDVWLTDEDGTRIPTDAVSEPECLCSDPAQQNGITDIGCPRHDPLPDDAGRPDRA